MPNINEFNGGKDMKVAVIGNPASWEKKSVDFTSQGFTPVSMKNEFKAIYPDAIKKAAEQKK